MFFYLYNYQDANMYNIRCLDIVDLVCLVEYTHASIVYNTLSCPILMQTYQLLENSGVTEVLV